MPQITFVILHYLAIDVTLQCVKSIQDIISYSNYKIVIVDNGSKNKTGEMLITLFQDSENVKVICLRENLGFSAGNNVGYSYAKDKLDSDYIIVLNNDTKMIQSDFIQKAIQCFEEEDYYVLGPDIINLENVHQSPQRNHVITKREAFSWLLKRYIVSKYLHIHKLLNLPDDFFILNKYIEYDKQRKNNLITNMKQSCVELQGACYIFSPLFVINSAIAFEELTFMYGEEALLALRCKKKHWKMLYNPDLKIMHAEKISTSIVNNNIVNKEIFYSDNHVKAIKAILKNMKKYN